MEINSENKKEDIAIDFKSIAEIAGCSADLVRKVNKGTRKNDLIQLMLEDARFDREMFLIKWSTKVKQQ
jgi:hypothetical protein